MNARPVSRFIGHFRNHPAIPMEEELMRSNEAAAAFNRFNRAADSLRDTVKAALENVAPKPPNGKSGGK